MQNQDSSLNSVEFKTLLDGSWVATHVPSQRVVNGLTKQEAEAAMQRALGMTESGNFEEPLTSDRFEGQAQQIALYLEGPVSKMLELHDGFARLEAYSQGVAHVRLGGGCQGCPSSLFTLSSGVKSDLQHHFGEDVVVDVQPVIE